MATLLTDKAFDFLGEAPLRDKAWMEANKAVYKQFLVEPLQAIVDFLAPSMAEVDAKMRGAVSRIYRDMRFAAAGQPLYRESMWICFENKEAEPDGRPGFFFEIYTDHWRYGMGFYSAGRAKMERYRAAIDADPAAFARLTATIPPTYSVMGDLYKKSRSSHLPEALQPWYERKNLWVQVDRPIDALVQSEALSELLRNELCALAPLYRFLRDI